ncbi:hypothetical protein HanXRQr2_Chr07g0301321 [Helianthus annuus]|uniref:Uncharacterized protein n=1 Tax=Helianthus annuus TaxID=4232 RepID=A0A9K3IMG9_HELAN|nr:hypothetical protein HanXRQr2_Chr07g0301321 [Helianthus annuus]KAJ0905234.1 hypothetical protein HanPSC8_Chr07g0291651 [Helianthus annuus]
MDVLLRRRVTVKRRNSGQHYVQNHAGTPHINLLVVLSTGQNLRRHIIRCTYDSGHHSGITHRKPLRRSEIRKLQFASRIKQNVIRLNITMRYT